MERDPDTRLELRWRAAFLTSVGVFLALALAVWIAGVLAMERDLYTWVARRSSPPVVAAFGWINYLGDARLLIPATVALPLAGIPGPLRRRWWLWVVAVLGAPVLEGVAKGVVARPRPEAPSMGFPSGHVAAVAVFAVLLAYLGQKIGRARATRSALWLVACLVILLVAIARVVLRAHWPLDTAGGAALGVACASAAIWWHERTFPRAEGVPDAAGHEVADTRGHAMTLRSGG